MKALRQARKLAPTLPDVNVQLAAAEKSARSEARKRRRGGGGDRCSGAASGSRVFESGYRESDELRQSGRSLTLDERLERNSRIRQPGAVEAGFLGKDEGSSCM